MARAYTPRDAHTLMNALVEQATGAQSITVVDTSTFVSAGELVMSTGLENVYNALSILVGRTYAAVRPYDARLQLINAVNSGVYTNRFRKISYYSKPAKPSGWFNTQLFTNLKDGFTAGQNEDAQGNPQSTKSQYEINSGVPLEINFGGSSTWQESLTIFENQLKVAFRSEDEFMTFWTGLVTQKDNDIEMEKEAFNRMTLLNHMAARVDFTNQNLIPGGAVNMTAAFNNRFGTAYTSAQLRTTYLTDFLAFLTSQIKLYSKQMRLNSLNYHWTPTLQRDGVTYNRLNRHTPKQNQRLLLYSPLLLEAESQVFSQVFHPEYLDVENYEGVTFWQAEDATMTNNPKLDVTPAVTDPQTGLQKAGNRIQLDYVIGMLYDEDAIMVDYQLETTNTSPLEARKGYRTQWYTFAKNAVSDLTENGIVFYMADP